MAFFIRICLVFFSITAICGSVWGLDDAGILDLSNRSYFEEVVQAINTAQTEILMVMYLVSYQPDDELNPVNKLLSALVSAKRRGVYVKVVLEYGAEELGNRKYLNAAVYEFLRGNGITVVYDTQGTTTHSKAIVIDRRIVIFGSCNWTKTSINLNNEINALVVSTGFAERIRNRIFDIKPLYLDSAEKQKMVSIPKEFILAGGPVSKMVGRNANRALDVYLWLLRTFRDKEEKTGRFEPLAEYLGISEKMTRTGYRRQIVKVMRNLDGEFGVLSFSYKRNIPGGGYAIILKLSPGDKIYLPSVYWEYGWDKELDITAKFCLLINLAERNDAQGEYRWKAPRGEIERKYSAKPWTVTKGMKTLQRYNIIDIVYGPYDVKKMHSEANTYIFRDMYSLAEANKESAKLSVEYGDDYLLAKKCAGVIYKNNAVSVIKRIIGLIKRYGRERTKSAFEILDGMARDNPKRSLRYAIGVVRRGMRDEGRGMRDGTSNFKPQTSKQIPNPKS